MSYKVWRARIELDLSSRLGSRTGFSVKYGIKTGSLRDKVYHLIYLE